MYLHSIFGALELFARGGGGGSGGGSGGDGGIWAIAGLAGSTVGAFIGKFARRILDKSKGRLVSAILIGGLTVFTIVITLFGGWFIFSLGVAFVVGLWAGWYAAFNGLWDKLAGRIQKSKEDVAKAASLDGAWSSERLNEHIQKTFIQFQQDWSQFNINATTAYLSPRFRTYNSLMLRALKELGRVNRLSDIKIIRSDIIDVKDDIDNTKDKFTVAIEAQMRDELIDEASGTILFVDNSSFVEYWSFIRNGDSWVLDDIQQDTAQDSEGVAETQVRNFASQNNMFYAIDMGWLFLPKRGVFFANGKFGKSDINNYVIGTINNHLMQVYTYEDYDKDGNSSSKHVIQMNLPKSYTGIIVKPRDKSILSRMSMFDGVPGNYKKQEFEWPDFNKRYSVYAIDSDRLAAFELINPGFMAYLYDKNPDFSIEVVDNIVFIYRSVDVGGILEDYKVGLEILFRAYKELKL